MKARFTVDARQFKAFAKLAPQEARKARNTWFRRGSLIVQRHQRLQAKKRFGRETAESDMQSRDPLRPKGVWSGSIQVRIGTSEARIGPNVPYAWWVERGSRAPRGVPRSHRRSRFRGHRPVERGTEDSEEPLFELAKKLTGKALGDASVRAGGRR